MDKLNRRLYSALMGTKGDDGPTQNRIIVTLLFTSFVLAFIVITAEFIYSNVNL